MKAFTTNHDIKFNSISNLTISETFINYLFIELCSKIDVWNGVALCKTSTPINTFRKYYNTGKNWWDQKKKAILGPVFLIKVLKMIENACNTISIKNNPKYKDIDTSNLIRQCQHALYVQVVILCIIYPSTTYFGSFCVNCIIYKL